MITPDIGESVFPMTETISRMEEKTTQILPRILSSQVGCSPHYYMLVEPGSDPLMHIHLPAEQGPLTSKVKPRGENQERKKIESES